MWLWPALGLAVIAAAAGIAGPDLPVVLPEHPAAFASKPMLVVLAVLPVTVASVCVWRGKRVAAGSALVAAALFGPGQLVRDLQLAVDVSGSSRPELVMPTSLEPLRGGAGLWVLIAGQVCAILAGVVATVAVRDARSDRAVPAARGELDVFAGFGGVPADAAGRADGAVDARDGAAAGRIGRQARFAAALCIGVVAAMVMLVAAPLRSDNPFLLGRTLLEQQGPAQVGSVLLLLAALLAPVIFGVVADGERAAGGMWGTAVGLLTVALPELVSGLVVPELHPTWCPWVLIVAAIAIALLGLAAGGRTSAGSGAPGVSTARELDLPRRGRLHRTAGVFGVLAGVVAVVSAFGSQIVVPPNLPPVHDVDKWLLVPAGVVVTGLGLLLLHPRGAAIARPAFAVAFVVVPMAAAAELDVVLTALQLPGVRAGLGAWLTVVATVLAAIGAGAAGLAGGVERDEVDLSERRLRPTVLGASLAGFALAVAGFGLPVERSSDYLPAGLWSGFRFASWGSVLALIAVLLVIVLAPLSRPRRAASLLAGAALVLGVRCMQLPVTMSRASDTAAGAGLPVSLAAVVVLVVAAVLAVASRRARVSGNTDLD